MKKYKLILAALVLSIPVIAQNEQDALRVSQYYHGGSARSIGMGGAIGALGTDFGALSVNPAASSIYRKGDFSLTTTFQSVETHSDFLGESRTDNGYGIGFDQIGLVMPIQKNNDSEFGIKSVSFGFGFNKLRDFRQNIVMDGVNNQHSLVDEFVYTANNNNEWNPFGDGLAWETWLIDYDSVAGVFYSDFDVSGYGQQQRRTVATEGSLGEYVFNMSTNIGDKVFVGGTMGIQKYRYRETWIHSEMDPNDIIDFFEAFKYRNTLETDGSGVNLKLGILAQPVSWLRFGGSVHTPTFFSLDDYFVSSMDTDLADGESTHQYTNSGEFEYDITTPFRATTSVAFIFPKRGILSVDYEFVDYSGARLTGDDYEFYEENQAIRNRYGNTNNIRIGGEMLFGPFFVRGGYSFYQSPYVKGEANAENHLSIISGGAGFRSNGLVFDFAVSRAGWDQVYFLYGDHSADLTNSSLRFTGTVGFRF